MIEIIATIDYSNGEVNGSGMRIIKEYQRCVNCKWCQKIPEASFVSGCLRSWKNATTSFLHLSLSHMGLSEKKGYTPQIRLSPLVAHHFPS